MTTPANAVPALIQADRSGNLFFSLDGGKTFNPAVAGSGGVATVTGISAGIVDNTDPANPVVQAQFGSDTTVQLPNSGATLVKAWEQIISLSTNTPGSEVSQVVLKLLAAGVQAVQMTVTPTTITLAPLLVLPTGSQAAPAISFAGDPTTGFYHVGTGILGITSGNTAEFSFTLGVFTITQSNAQIVFGSGGANIQLSTGSLALTPQSTFHVFVNAARFQQAKGANVASAQPLTVGTDGNYWVITGTTGIQGIVTTKFLAGVKIALELPSGITITHNSGAPGTSAAAILLRGAASLTTAATYVLELYYNGTNWIQPS